MRNFNFLISEHLDDRLKCESDRSGASLSEIVRRAIDEYLERKERRRTNNAPKSRHREAEAEPIPSPR
jgi:predicted DNA-binding protein